MKNNPNMSTIYPPDTSTSLLDWKSWIGKVLSDVELDRHVIATPLQVVMIKDLSQLITIMIAAHKLDVLLSFS